MARCCGGATCGCVVQAGSHVTITGVGSSQNPFVVAADVDVEASDNSTFNVSVGGSGTSASPWAIAVSYATTAKLDDIPDVVITSPTNGQVVVYDSSTSTWKNGPQTTASAGSVQHDSSMSGDGSAGTPLVINEDPNGYLVTAATGLGLSDTGKTLLVRRYGTDVARSADTITPVLNSVSMLDTNPGQQDYWNGSQWLPVTNGMKRNLGTEFMALSGSYVANMPITIITRVLSFTTDSVGGFTLLSPTDLTGAAGVLVCHFQETGSIPFKAMAYSNINQVSGTAYRIDDGTAYASQALTGVVTAYIY